MRYEDEPNLYTAADLSGDIALSQLFCGFLKFIGVAVAIGLLITLFRK